MSDEELLTIRPIEGGAALVGEIDAHTAGRLTYAFDDPGDLVLDLSGVEFVDSSGLRVLIELHQNRSRAGDTLVLRTPSPAVRRLLEISGVADYLTVDDGPTS
jgi:anti-sigma B factor antagonist